MASLKKESGNNRYVIISLLFSGAPRVGEFNVGKGVLPCAFFAPLLLSFCTASQRGICRMRMPFMSRIERKYCLISTSCLAGLSNIFMYYFIFDIIVCILVSFHHRGHFVIVIIRNLNLISVQSWTYRYLDIWRMGAFPRCFLPSPLPTICTSGPHGQEKVWRGNSPGVPLLTPPHSLHSQSTSLIESVVGEDGGIPCLLPSHPLQWSAYKVKSA